jgi:hypothetical protein
MATAKVKPKKRAIAAMESFIVVLGVGWVFRGRDISK